MLFQMILYFSILSFGFYTVAIISLAFLYTGISESADFKIEQRAYVKIRTLLQVSTTDIHKDLQGFDGGL